MDRAIGIRAAIVLVFFLPAWVSDSSGFLSWLLLFAP